MEKYDIINMMIEDKITIAKILFLRLNYYFRDK